MSKYFLVPALVAVSLLGACASREPVAPAPAPVVVVPTAPAVVAVPAAPGTVIVPQAIPLRAGYGRIETITPVPGAMSPSTGGSSPTTRIGVRMEDGTFQYADTGAPNLTVGDRIEFTRDGYIRHPV